MVVDARSVPAGTCLESDVCIAGGGVAGLTLARELIDAPVRVCLLESGGREPDPETQALYQGDNVGYPYFPLDTARARHLGGSSARWHVPLGGDRVGARMRPLDAIDFEERSWVPWSGWPFGKRELDPYYRRAETACRLEPATYDVEDWEDPQRRPRMRFDRPDVETVIYKFCPREVFAREHPDAVIGARNVTTVLHANVLQIETNAAANHVERLHAGTLQGTRFDVTARIVVLAAGGIETPRLLLLSNANQPSGLGNQHDLVGRFFMEHLHFWSGMLVPPSPDIFERTALYNDVQTVRGVPLIGKLALSEAVLRREKLLNQNIQLVPEARLNPFKYRRLSPEPLASLKALLRPENAARTSEHLRTVVTGWNDVAVAGIRKVRSAVASLPTTQVFMFANMSEQVPNPESRVTLGSEVDAFGQRRAQLNWKITEQDIRSVRRTQEIIACALERIGVGRFFRQLLDDVPPPNTHGGYHHMGTTRMHADPRKGVVDPDCRVHGIHNLYIAGPSVFPTGGYANPVLTTVGLAIRLADHLKQAMA